ncbi:MAG: translocation/assembly module TamB domain-containing protein [Thermodesulfobacteriota bacterium]
MRYKIVITAGVVLSLFAFITIAAYYFTQTAYFRNLVKNSAERIVSSLTGQSFKIDEVEGNFFYNIKLKDVSFEVGNESFVAVKELSITYSIPQMLNTALIFSKVIPVDGLSVNGARVNLIKYGDGTWNFDKIGSGKEKEKEKDKEKKGPPQWSVIVSELLLKDCLVTLDDRENKKVAKYGIDETKLSAKLVNITEKIEIDLNNADLNAPSENINIKGLKAKAFYSGDKAEIKDLELVFNGAEIKLNAEAANLKDNPKFSFSVSAQNYKLEDVGTFNLESEGRGEFKSLKSIDAELSIKIPESELYGKKLSGSLDNISVSGTEINLGEGKIKSDLGDLNLSGKGDLVRLITGEGKNSFTADVSLKDVKTTEIFALIEEKTEKKTQGVNTELGAILDADIHADGSWAEFRDLVINGTINNLHVKGKQAGELKLTGSVDYSQAGLGLNVKTTLKDVDLGTVLSKEELKSKITSDLSMNGLIPLKGDTLQKLSASVKGEVKPSSIFNFNLKKGVVDASFDKERLTVRALSLDGDLFKFDVKDWSAGRKGMKFAYSLEVRDLGLISRFMPANKFGGTLKAEGRAEGEIKNPKISVDAKIGNFKMNDVFSAETIIIKCDGTIDLDNPDIRADIRAENAKIKEKKIKSIEVKARSEEKGINLIATAIENDSFDYEVVTTLRDLVANEKHIEISKIRLHLENSNLENRGRILLTIAPNGLIVDSFNLYYKDSSALADAKIFYNGSVKGELELNNLDLNDIVKAISPKTEVEGALSANISVNGTMTAPQFNAKLNAGKIVYKDFKNDNVSLDLNYIDKNLTLKFLITDNSATILQASGNADLDLNLTELGENLKKARFNLDVSSKGVDLSPLTGISSEIEKSDGFIVVDLKAAGTIDNPSVNGQLVLKDADFKIKSLRNEFKITNALIQLQGQKGYLKQTEIVSGNGKGTFEGQIDIPNMSYDLSADMQDFLVKPKQISANISGKLNLKGEEERVNVEGKLMVAKARITMPEKQEKEIEDIKFADENKEEFVVGNDGQTDYFKQNIALKLQIEMSKNNWVKGRGANIELSGDLDVNKAFGQSVRIAGNINTVRGTYETLGKLFRIDQGQVSFSGGETINPFLDITALYRVSSAQIYVKIGGTVDKPVLKLTSDPPMTETDIVSYIVFGAPSDQIGSSNRASIQGAATGIAGGIASAQLQKLLGSKFALDVVSVESGGSSGPQVQMGKYLTPELYIAYERESTESLIDSTIITENKVLIEYTIFKNITINGDFGGENPGVDIFYNFNY